MRSGQRLRAGFAQKYPPGIDPQILYQMVLHDVRAAGGQARQILVRDIDQLAQLGFLHFAGHLLVQADGVLLLFHGFVLVGLPEQVRIFLVRDFQLVQHGILTHLA